MQSIKIGKEIQPEAKEVSAPTVSKVQEPNMKKEQRNIPTQNTENHISEVRRTPPSISAIRSKTPSAEQKEDTAVVKKEVKKASSKTTSAVPGVSLPRTGAVKKTASPKPDLQKKKARATEKAVPQSTPAQTREELEEVLDEELTQDAILEEIPVDEPEESAPAPRKMTLNERRQQKKQQQIEQNLSALDLICRRSGLTKDDVAMIKTFYDLFLAKAPFATFVETLANMKNTH